jgi:drug/metabolite transporter (DMT)-like permease
MTWIDARMARVRDDAQSAALLAIVATVLTWGMASPLIKSASIGGEALVFYRLWIGAFALFAFVRLSRRVLRENAWRLALLAGALFGANVLCFVFSIKLTTVANATLIGALQPALTLLVAGRLFGEIVRPRDILCVALAMAGVSIVIVGSAGTPEWNPAGDALAVCAVLTFTVYFLVTKHARATSGTVEYMALVHIAAAVVVTPTVLARPGELVDLQARDIAIVLFFALISGTLGQLVVGWAQRYVDVSVSSLMLLGVPVVASIAAWAMLDEALGPVQIAGGAITLAAIGAMVWQRPGPATEIESVPVGAAGD